MLGKAKTFISGLVRLGGKVQTLTNPFPVKSYLLRPARKLGKRLPPQNIGTLPAYIQNWFEEEACLPAHLLYEFDRVHVSWHGVVLRGLRVFVPSIAYPIFEDEFSGTFLLRQWVANKITLSQPAGLIYDHWAAGNYYHWLVDSLPRLLLLRVKYPHCVLLAPAPVHDYVRITTQALGFQLLQPVLATEFTHVLKLFMPSHVAPPGKQDPELMRQVRSEVKQALGHFGAAKTSTGRRLYVSRSKQKFRRLVNESELAMLFDKYGIETIYFEEMSFEQQVATMQGVELLIGLHGANLTNMLFLNANARVIELMNNTICNLCYFQLASNLELAYYAVPCLAVADSGSITVPNSEDVVVNVSLLIGILENLYGK
jgi:hypothetical protein